jgi:oligoribonuclease NrnB/cAMP/cGMP phosphodiesterase (DHH superfamily)
VNKTLCIFHSGCPDGYGAAWVVRQALGSDNVEFFPGVYQQPPPDVTGRNVVIVDFSYKRLVMDEMAKVAKSITILDHHESAGRDLATFGMSAYDEATTKVVFDMQRSGAGIAWDYYFPDRVRPAGINYIEDHDLWRKQLTSSDEFSMGLHSYPYDFEIWDSILAKPSVLINEGKAILRFYRRQVEKVKAEAYDAVFPMSMNKTVKVRVANCPYIFASEVASEIIGDADFGACFFEKSDGSWQYSLRSLGDFNVAEIAETYGGGGHKNAAGFSVSQLVHVRSEPDSDPVLHEYTSPWSGKDIIRTPY